MIDLSHELKKKRNHFAKYVIDSTIGTRSRNGDTPSEQNHSSVVAWIGEKFAGELDGLLIQLLKRHKSLCLKINAEITKYHLEMITIIHKMKCNKAPDELIQAAEFLCMPAYIHYKSQTLPQSKRYVCETQEDGSIHVFNP